VVLEEALELTEGTSGITPRFMSPRMPSICEEIEDDTYGDDARQCMQTLNIISSGVYKIQEVENLIIN
jgi:hypothetical protein